MDEQTLIHTSRWFANIDGKFPYDKISVIPQGRHSLPRDIGSLVIENWNNIVQDRRLNLLNHYSEQDIVEESIDGLTRLYVIENNVKRPRLFSGPMTRLNNYRIVDNRIFLEFGETNYADLLATNNRDPFGILQVHGKKGLANPINVSVCMSVQDGDFEELFTFDRGFGLGEYPSKGDSREERLEICVAGGIDTQYTHPHDAAYKEIFEEIGMLPNLGDQEYNYKQRGIVPLHAKMRFGTLENGTKLTLVTSPEGYKTRFFFNEATGNNLVCLGMVTNVDPYDKDESGKPIQHFRPELLYFVSTDLQKEDAHELWVRSQEHLGINFIPFTEDGLGQYLLDRYLNMLPPGHAALMYAGKERFGEGWFNEALKQTNEKFPVEAGHPYYSRVESGSIPAPMTEILD
jgi:hypothetical protein